MLAGHWQFHCPECGMGDFELGRLAADQELACDVCWATRQTDPSYCLTASCYRRSRCRLFEDLPFPCSAAEGGFLAPAKLPEGDARS
jgi:hypothetical protein